jgi:pantoate--beta-alanine ligase
MQSISSSYIREGKKIGFVPTMGYLHEGHLSLIRKSKSENDITIASVFVNPTQFAPNEDLDKYPRDFERDEKLLSDEGTDIIFYPAKDDIYPEGFQTYVNVEEVTSDFEGKIRPTHFKGVTTIVTILFNIVKPDKAYFGQKDAQQVYVIKRMVNDLRQGVQVIVCPIVRENDGLAMSSRNIYLSPEERKKALTLNTTLNYLKELAEKGERNCNTLTEEGIKLFNNVNNIIPEYLVVVDTESFSKADTIISGRQYLFLVAARVGKTRLIDNIMFQTA